MPSSRPGLLGPGEAPGHESKALEMPPAGSKACSLIGKDAGQRETERPQKIIPGEITGKIHMSSNVKCKGDHS